MVFNYISIMGEVINKEKFESIVKNVVVDTNTILNNWKVNGKIPTYEDKKSLVRGLFARHIKDKFGYQVYKKYVQKSTILPSIPLYTLDDITIDNIYLNYSNVYLDGLKLVISNKNIFTNIVDKPSNIQITVDYETITNIKFN